MSNEIHCWAHFLWPTRGSSFIYFRDTCHLLLCREPNMHQSMCPADFVDEPPGEILFLNFKFIIKFLRVLRKVLTNFRTCTVADPGFSSSRYVNPRGGAQKFIIGENICLKLQEIGPRGVSLGVNLRSANELYYFHSNSSQRKITMASLIRKPQELRS